MKTLKYTFLIIISLMSLSTNTFSQRLTSYWMQHLPQASFLNPAKQPGCKLFIDIPVLPNFDINVNHSGFTINDAIIPRPYTSNQYMINLNGIESVLKEKNNINVEVDISLLNLGILLKNDMYVSAGINYKFSEFFQYPKALIELRRGNYRKNKKPLIFNFKQNLNLYREIYIGASKEINDGFFIGGKIKYLSGYLNVKASEMNIEWYTNTAEEGMYEWTFNSDFDIKAASMECWNFIDSTNQITAEEIYESFIDPESNISSYVFPGNAGLAIDIGAEYKINDRLNLSAALTDFGFIKWKTNSRIMTQKASFTFDGVNVAKYIGNINDSKGSDLKNTGDELLKDIKDTLLNVFNPEIKEEAYSAGINTKLFLGTNFKIIDRLDLGLFYKGAFYNKTLASSYTFSLNTNFFKAWSYTISYSIMNYSANNIGMGLACKVGPFQMYIITDNIAAPFWAVNESDLSDKMLKNTKNLNLAFGLNFIICGNKYDIGLME